MIQNLEQHYKVLGLTPGASLEEVNQAYKDLVFIWHPDRVPQDNERLIQKSVEKLQEINEARDSLRSYYRKYPKQATTKTQPKPNNYPRSPYYSDRYQTPNSYTNRYRDADDRRKSYDSSYSDRQQRNPRPGRPWDYRTYYTSNPNNQTTGRDGYRDFRQPSRDTTPSRPVENNHARPYQKDLRGANLSRSNFKEKDFAGRNLSEADLSYSDLSDSFLHKIILEGANLQGANLKGANLLQANLRGANLQEANLIGADLSGSDLSGANLSGAKVGFSNKLMVKITAVKLTGATLPDGSIHP